MKRYALAAAVVALSLFAAPLAHAQAVGSPAPVQQNQSRLDASSGVCALADSVWTIFLMSCMPQIGQLPGVSLMMKGCMAQV